MKTSPGVAVVSSWPEAIDYWDTAEWDDLRQGMLNQYRVYIYTNAKERLGGWNETIRAVKKLTVPLVERKAKDVIQENNLPGAFRTEVCSDVALFCMEAEYADVCPPGFFTRLGAWYLDGHFPCGWWGHFPEGKLIVY